jgi:hypothetical protein
MTSEQGQPGEPKKSCSRQLNSYSVVSLSSKLHNTLDLSVYRIFLRQVPSGFGMKNIKSHSAGFCENLQTSAPNGNSNQLITNL